MTNLIQRDILCLAVSHNIFLNSKERHRIVNEENDVNIIGWSVPVWCNVNPYTNEATSTDEPAQEIFCNYIITKNDGNKIVEIKEDGYQINIKSDDIRKRLLDVAERGAECINFTHHSEEEIDGLYFRTIHFVSINDINLLKNSLTTT